VGNVEIILLLHSDQAVGTFRQEMPAPLHRIPWLRPGEDSAVTDAPSTSNFETSASEYSGELQDLSDICELAESS